jgi:hypothetical protein
VHLWTVPNLVGALRLVAQNHEYLSVDVVGIQMSHPLVGRNDAVGSCDHGPMELETHSLISPSSCRKSRWMIRVGQQPRPQFNSTKSPRR